tara:strand:- start:204 stop:803 length:600 start_codon:yes stop_codon:yes gene_type:complete
VNAIRHIKQDIFFYICQLLRVTVFTLLLTAGFFLGPEPQYYELRGSKFNYFANGICLILIFIIIYQAFLRNPLPKLKSSTFECYLFATLISLALLITSDFVLLWLLPVPEWSEMVEASGFILALIFQLTGNLIMFLMWLYCYITITSIRDKSKLARQLKDQKLASLMNQINPHFLFNSLNTIRGMIYEDLWGGPVSQLR